MEAIGLPANEEEFHWAQVEKKGNVFTLIHLQIFVEPYCVPGTVLVLGTQH